MDQPVGHFAILLGDSTASLESDLFTLVGVEDLEGTPLQRFEAQDVGADTPVLLHFRREARGTMFFLWFLVPLAAAAFVFGFVRWRRQYGDHAVATPTADPTALASAIAALDAAYAGKETDEYRARRAALKDRLSKLLEEQG
jgi:hypothetical protein